MKIAYVLPEKDQKGGIQEFAKSISSFISNKHHIEWFDYKYDDFLFQVFNKILSALTVKISLLLFNYIIIYYFRIKYKLNEFDLIHFWHIDAAMAFTQKRYIVTCHALEILPKNVSNYKQVMYKRALQNAEKITADSSYTKKLIIENFSIDGNKIIVVNPGVDIKKFDRPHNNSSKIRIGSIARFVPRKNFLNIIKGLDILSKQVDFTYYIAGDGVQKNEILSALEHVSFEWKYLGKITDEVKYSEFYPSIDIFVLPTLSLPDSVEGFGIVYIEANSAHVPVIAAANGGVIDAVKEGQSGLFCDPSNPSDIAEKIKIMLRDLDAFKQNARAWVIKFDVKNVAAHFEKIYARK